MKDFKRKGHSSLLEHLEAHCKFPLIVTFLETLTNNSKEVHDSCTVDGAQDALKLMLQNNINPFTPRVKPWVNKCGCDFEVCGWNPSVRPFKSKLLSCTFMQYLLSFCKMKFKTFSFLSFELSTLGSERVNSVLSLWVFSGSSTLSPFMLELHTGHGLLSHLGDSVVYS